MIDLNNLKKVEFPSTPFPPSSEQIKAIVKVKNANYVPEGVIVCAQIDPQIFTCELSTAQLIVLEKDPQVVSISTGKRYF